MYIPDDLKHSPENKNNPPCLRCGHDCHCGEPCPEKSCVCPTCVHNPDELSDEDILI